MEHETKLKAFKAMSDSTRLQIVEFLSACCCGQAAVHEDGGVEGPTAGEVCCQITGATQITSTVSHHLHELESAGLVALEKKGKATLCSLKPEAFTDMAAYITGLADGKGASDCDDSASACCEAESGSECGCGEAGCCG